MRGKVKAVRSKLQNRTRGRILSGAAALLTAVSVFVCGCGESAEAKEARLLGIEQMEAGQLEEAIQSLDTALSHGDGVVDEFELDLLKYRGEAEYRLGDYRAAAHTYGILADVDENKPEYISYRDNAELQLINQQGVQLFEEGKDQEAMELFESALAQLSQKETLTEADHVLRGALICNIGAVYEARGEFEKALQQFETCEDAYGASPELEKEIAFLESRLTEE